MDSTWKNVAEAHNRVIDEIITFRKTAWSISDAEAEKIRKENYFASEVQENG